MIIFNLFMGITKLVSYQIFVHSQAPYAQTHDPVSQSSNLLERNKFLNLSSLQDNGDAWYVELSFVGRLVTYVVILGTHPNLKTLLSTLTDPFLVENLDRETGFSLALQDFLC